MIPIIVLKDFQQVMSYRTAHKGAQHTESVGMDSASVIATGEDLPVILKFVLICVDLVLAMEIVIMIKVTVFAIQDSLESLVHCCHIQTLKGILGIK